MKHRFLQFGDTCREVFTKNPTIPKHELPHICDASLEVGIKGINEEICEKLAINICGGAHILDNAKTVLLNNCVDCSIYSKLNTFSFFVWASFFVHKA